MTSDISEDEPRACTDSQNTDLMKHYAAISDSAPAGMVSCGPCGDGGVREGCGFKYGSQKRPG